MTPSVHHVNSSPPVTPSKPSAQKPEATAQDASRKPAAGAQVHISAAARAALAQAQEFKETPVQTAAEARRGDHQAQRLLAREAAAKTG